MADQLGLAIPITSYRIGCISWTYSDWIGAFYPADAKSSELLSLYSKVFDIVEIDSTFYHIPTASTIRQWKEKTAENFLFTAKMPRRITHESRLKNVSGPMKTFETAVKGLGSKLACIMMQLPPNFRFEKGFDLLSQFVDTIDSEIKYAIEFRDVSWFRKETYDLLEKNKITLVWSVNESTKGKIDPQLTSDFLYLRFMGEFREFSKFNRVQKEKPDILKQSIEYLEKIAVNVNNVFVLASNHFEGFAPSTANRYRRMLGLSEINWEEKMGPKFFRNGDMTSDAKSESCASPRSN